MTVYYQPGCGLDRCKKDERRCNCSCHKCDCNSCPPVNCKPEKVVFKCNNISGASGVSIIAIGTTVVPRNLGSVSVPELCCFKKPCVKVDFSAIVFFGAIVDIGTTITFRIFKRCGNGEEIEIQSFDITQELAIAAGTSMPVAFSVCDCDGCHSGCCVYRVSVEATADVAVASAINVNQGTISVIASDIC